jgi:hypothetical protein
MIGTPTSGAFWDVSGAATPANAAQPLLDLALDGAVARGPLERQRALDERVPQSRGSSAWRRAGRGPCGREIEAIAHAPSLPGRRAVPSDASGFRGSWAGPRW